LKNNTLRNAFAPFDYAIISESSLNCHKLQAFFTDFAANQENGEFRNEDLDPSTLHRAGSFDRLRAGYFVQDRVLSWVEFEPNQQGNWLIGGVVNWLNS
jgi:hypothetical protein